MPDPRLNEIDLLAYADGQLDEYRRLHVETILSADPAAAAGLMGDLARRTALGLALRERKAEPSLELKTRLLARRGNYALGRAPMALAAAVCAAVLAGLGGVGISRIATSPDTKGVVEDAFQSREATLARIRMTSQVETPHIALSELRNAVRIRLPSLPSGWSVLDVQVFPSDAGPSVQLLIDTGDAGRVFLFASREDEGEGAGAPVLIRYDGETVAFWEVEGQSFTLISEGPRHELRTMAFDLANNRLL